MPYSYGLAEQATTLATRPFARELRDDLLSKAADQETVELDFEGVRSVSHSFADEFVARLAEDSKAGVVGFEVHATGLSPEVARVLQAALDRRGLQVPELA